MSLGGCKSMRQLPRLHKDHIKLSNSMLLESKIGSGNHGKHFLIMWAVVRNQMEFPWYRDGQ